MFEQILEKGKHSFKPLSELMSVNTKAMEQFASQQSSFVSDCLSESFKQVQELTTKRDLGSVIESQKAYAESLQKKWIDNAKSTLELMNEVRSDSTAIIENAVSAEKTEDKPKSGPRKAA